MKGYHGERSQVQPSSGHRCRCIPEDCQHPANYIQHGPEGRPPYPLSPSEPCSLEHPYCPARSPGAASECPGGPLSELPSASASSTFPRMHHVPQPYDSCDECMATAAHPASKINRLPPTLLDQFEKQLPLHHDGFHTLQYPRAGGAEPRSESPSRIRHLVHSVQKLFAKSHSLEAPAKREYNGSRHGKRSKSKDRKVDSRHRSKVMGWWSSDDNLDSDSSYMVSGRHAADQGTQYCVDAPESAFRDLTLKSLKGGGEGKCLACAGMSMSLDGQTVKRSAWHTMTVSQAREAQGLASQPRDPASSHACLPLQVPQDEWSGYPAVGKDGEIPCRRMRSGSYIKAMGDEDSADSDISAKVLPRAATRRDSYRPSLRLRFQMLCLNLLLLVRSLLFPLSLIRFASRHYSDSYICVDVPHGISCPARPHLSTPLLTRCSPQINDELNHQFEAVCESVFGEVESQAVEALDLPGCFRMRSHSYLRAIQAGCSQDDDCLSLFSMSAPAGPSITSGIRSSLWAPSWLQACLSAMGYSELPYQHPPSVPRQVEAVSDSDTESRSQREFHSIGVQVEEDKRYCATRLG
uniref:DLG associated protein 3 n=1 Tax=Amazona collaria TaxID=241587 RepID=A0A8B9F165_9PSIT